MTRIDELLGDVFADMVAEVEPVDFVTRARAASHRIRNRRRVVASAAAIALIASVGATFASRRGSTESTARPTELALDTLTVGTPARLSMLLTFSAERGIGASLGPGGGTFVGRDAATGAFVRLVLPVPNANDPLTLYSLTDSGKSLYAGSAGGGTDIRNLSTGVRTHIDSSPCPVGQDSGGASIDLSPDGTHYSMSLVCADSMTVQVFETATGRAVAPALARADTRSFALPGMWSADSRLLALGGESESVIMAGASGMVTSRLAGSAKPRGWSADSRRLIGWQRSAGASLPVVFDVTDGSVAQLRAPGPDLYPVGWDTTDRVVWAQIHETAGGTSLVSADIDGHNVTEWLRITGDLTLQQIEWTTAPVR